MLPFVPFQLAVALLALTCVVYGNKFPPPTEVNMTVFEQVRSDLNLVHFFAIMSSGKNEKTWKNNLLNPNNTSLSWRKVYTIFTVRNPSTPLRNSELKRYATLGKVIPRFLLDRSTVSNSFEMLDNTTQAVNFCVERSSATGKYSLLIRQSRQSVRVIPLNLISVNPDGVVYELNTNLWDEQGDLKSNTLLQRLREKPTLTDFMNKMGLKDKTEENWLDNVPGANNEDVKTVIAVRNFIGESNPDHFKYYVVKTRPTQLNIPDAATTEVLFDKTGVSTDIFRFCKITPEFTTYGGLNDAKLRLQTCDHNYVGRFLNIWGVSHLVHFLFHPHISSYDVDIIMLQGPNGVLQDGKYIKPTPNQRLKWWSLDERDLIDPLYI